MQSHPVRTDDDRAAALDLLLLLADGRADAREYRRAVDLLDDVEETVGALPPEYMFKRRDWADRALASWPIR